MMFFSVNISYLWNSVKKQEVFLLREIFEHPFMQLTEPTSDHQLVADFLKGKVSAFDMLYEKYSRRLYGFAFMLLKNKEDALDIVQETFLRIWKKRKELAEEKSVKSFLFTISYNLIIDQLRKRLNDKNYIESLERRFSFTETSIENRAEFNLLDNKIHDLINELPPKRKEIFRLSREKGFSNKEIAETLKISVKTVETQISLATKYLRTGLTDGSLPAILFASLFC